MADKSNRAAERDSVSNAKMKRAELTFTFQLDPIEKSAGDAGDALRSSPEHAGAYGEVVLAPGLGHEGQWKRGARLPFQNHSSCEWQLCAPKAAVEVGLGAPGLSAWSFEIFEKQSIIQRRAPIACGRPLSPRAASYVLASDVSVFLATFQAIEALERTGETPRWYVAFERQSVKDPDHIGTA